MNILVVYAHPRPQCFNAQVRDTFVEAARARGHAVRVRDLYAMGFDPIVKEADLAAARGLAPVAPDVTEEQDLVRWAEVIAMISPVWWIGWPAMMKGWVDRTFALNFAYGYGPKGVVGLLEGRRAIVISTTGSTAAHWTESGKREAVRMSQDVGTMELSGLVMCEHLTLSPVGRLTPAEAFAGYLDEVRALVGRHL